MEVGENVILDSTNLNIVTSLRRILDDLMKLKIQGNIVVLNISSTYNYFEVLR